MSENKSTPDALDYRSLRNALGSFATGVTIITAVKHDGTLVGLTANSFSSVSLNPALVSWSLANHSPSMPVFQDCTHYAIHVLCKDQQELAMRFSQSRDDKFSELDLREGLGGAPLLSGALAIFQCANAYRHSGGDHIIFLGEVAEFECNDGQPLIFHGGKFGDLVPQR